MLVYSGSGRDVDNVWVGGEHLVVEGKLRRRPYAEIRSDYSVTYQDFWARVAKNKKVK